VRSSSLRPARHSLRGSPGETITHLAFYSEGPKAMSAITVAKEVFKRKP
jgi:hypothetical protein